jgi:hypothetical protein
MANTNPFGSGTKGQAGDFEPPQYYVGTVGQGPWPNNTNSGYANYGKPPGFINFQPFGDDHRYMDYRDTPWRPKTRMWFGPMTMMDFLSNMNMVRYWAPGTGREAPMYQLKFGVQTALDEVQANHPNDFCSLVGFSRPYATAGGTTPGVLGGYYNEPLMGLSQDYNSVRNALWYSQYSIVKQTEFSPYDSDPTYGPAPGGANTYGGGLIANVPHAIEGTTSPYAMMLAFNQFSNDTATYSAGTIPGNNGGGGRNGADRLLIFETDGAASFVATPQLDPATSGLYNGVPGTGGSYFKVRYALGELPDGVYVGTPPTFSSGDPITQTKKMGDVMCALTTAAKPGFSTSRVPVRIHCIAFGSMFSGTLSTPAVNALDLLGYLEYDGKTQATYTAPATLATEKIINSPVFYSTTTPIGRLQQMRQAYRDALQSSVSVTLLQ